MLIVVDKCWFQSATTAEIRRLKSQYRLVLPDTFYLELLTDENRENRASLARKFGPAENPGARVFLPELLHWEIERREPAHPLDQFLKDNFYLNPGLTVPTFPFREDDSKQLARWENKNIAAVEQFKAQASTIAHWFPELKHFPPSGSAHLIDEAMVKAGNPQIVLEIYDRFRSNRMPPTQILDSRWILFRYTQMNLFASLEYARRYGAGAATVVSKRLHNDLMDLDYLILATMVGAFATLDKIPRKFFRLACPNGLLIPEIMEAPES